MEHGSFKFKSFEVSHQRSSMKVGVDAVLLGAWAGEKPGKILEVGTGCGVIALMLAQRFPESGVLAIDIDEDSIEEAKVNFENSLWGERLEARLVEFSVFCCRFSEEDGKFDLIVSNPPYFASGVGNPLTPREKARHQSTLSAFSLLEKSKVMLTDSGRLAMIFPNEYYDKVKEYGEREGYVRLRECRIRNREGRSEKRIMIEFGKRDFYGDTACEVENLVMFEGEEPTKRYRELCKEFYLKF